MYNLYDRLPDCITAHGRQIPIYTDFRHWLKFEELIKNGCKYKDIIYLLELPEDKAQIDDDVIDALIEFYNFTPKYPTGKGGKNIVSFDDDAPYIYAAFWKNYKIDLTQKNLHWWQFLALFRGLFNEYKDILGYRCYKGDDKDMQALKRDWSLRDVNNSDPDIVHILLHGGNFNG